MRLNNSRWSLTEQLGICLLTYSRITRVENILFLFFFPIYSKVVLLYSHFKKYLATKKTTSKQGVKFDLSES